MKKSVLIIVNIVLIVAIFGLLGIQSAAKTDLAKGFDGNSANSGFLDNSGLAENPNELTELIQKTSEELEMNIFIY
ncbi:MAG: hypothetical protein K2J40_01745, partial [Ruminococcus sp.]|nr:hypothetical protein [Ruminococcus sp.]